MTRRAWWIVGAVVGALLLVAGAVALVAARGDEPSPPPSTQAASPGPATQVPSPSPTPVPDEEASDEAPPAAPTSPAPEAPPEAPPVAGGPAPTAAPADEPSSSLRTVTVTVPDASWDPAGSIAAAGIVDDVVETGGRCTLVATSGGARTMATSTARGDATATYCGTLRLPTTDLAPGAWSVVVEYLSATARGASAPVVVQVG